MSSWLRTVTPEFLDERFGADVVNHTLAHTRVYAGPIAFDSAGRLVAAVVECSDAGKLDLPMKVVVRINDRGAGPQVIDVSCACRRGRVCEHVQWLLIDVGFSAQLHAALLEHGVSTAPLLDELPSVRARALGERTLDERLAAWLPPRRFDDDFEMDIEPISLATTQATEGRAAILLRHRRPHGQRREIVPARDVLAARLTPKHRRLVELTSPYHTGKDALIATRGQASLLVHLLRDEIAGIFTHGWKTRVKYAPLDAHVRPAIERHDQRVVASWVDPAGNQVGLAEASFLFAGPFPHLYVPATNTFHVVDPNVDLDAALGMQRVSSLHLANDETADRVGRALLLRGRKLGVKLPPPESFGLPALDKPGSFEIRLTGSPLDVTAEVLAIYDGIGPVPAFDNQEEVDRDLDAEEDALAQLNEAGFAFDEDRQALVAVDDRAVHLWSGGLEKLRASQNPKFNIVVTESIANTRLAPPVELDVRVKDRVGWLDTELEFRAGALKIEMKVLEKALANKQGWVVLSDGALAKISEAVAAIVDDCHDISLSDSGGLPLPPHQIGRIARWIELADADGQGRLKIELSERLATFRARVTSPLEPRLPTNLAAELRPYQRTGLAWLQLLRDLGTGGLLADDMGLGKTLMTLSLIERAREEACKIESKPTLVVCPTSVVGNWLREAARFTPSLRAVAYTGPDRKRRVHDFHDHDLIVTTYGIFRLDIDRLTKTRFRIVVLDEAQNIKNPASQSARCARKIDADMRLALTGTPVENRLNELWSLMTFANPGILGTVAEFDERFERPITHYPEGEVAKRLRAIVQPFLLRRTKSAVLIDLPPKTEVERTCVFGLQQKKLYDALALTLRKVIASKSTKRKDAETRLAVLTAILRLRQMACDPRLVDPDVPPETSAKRAVFLETVRELVSEERRALVFSQFVELLDLWREDLDQLKIPYEYLDGSMSTHARDEVVSRFQAGNAPLFLISLKAGGSGLNLTAADTVIHIDPWWNPAIEDQATDRAHRIGQTKPVTVIRLVAQGTIEDKMSLLKEEKRDLARAILDDAEIDLLLGDVEGDLDEDDDDADDPPEVSSESGFA